MSTLWKLDETLIQINKNIKHLRKCQGHKFAHSFNGYGQCEKCKGYHKHLKPFPNALYYGYGTVAELSAFRYMTI